MEIISHLLVLFDKQQSSHIHYKLLSFDNITIIIYIYNLLPNKSTPLIAFFYQWNACSTLLLILMKGKNTRGSLKLPWNPSPSQR